MKGPESQVGTLALSQPCASDTGRNTIVGRRGLGPRTVSDRRRSPSLGALPRKKCEPTLSSD